MDKIVRRDVKSTASPGRILASLQASMNLALVPKTVISNSSVIFHMAFPSGWKGEPSNRTTVAPTEREETSQFHIIHPQVVK